MVRFGQREIAKKPIKICHVNVHNINSKLIEQNLILSI